MHSFTHSLTDSRTHAPPQVVRKSFRVCRGPAFSTERKRRAADLTKEMLDSGEWATTAFKVRVSVGLSNLRLGAIVLLT
jgi:hypothetical protein